MSARRQPPRGFWLSWVLGLALLVVVVSAVLHVSEERAIFRLLREADPSWLAVARPERSAAAFRTAWIVAWYVRPTCAVAANSDELVASAGSALTSSR